MGEAIMSGIKDQRSKFRNLSPNREIIAALEELRNDVENINRRFTGQFRTQVIDDGFVCTVTVQGMTYGYKLVDKGLGMMEREIMIRPADGGTIGELNEEDRERYIVPVFEVFFKEGYTDIKPLVIQGCLVFKQKFQIAFLFEHQPGLVVPGGRH